MSTKALETLSDINHPSYIALPFPPSGDADELVLLDSKWLSFHRSIEGPITIAKTRFSIDDGVQWVALLGDGSRWTMLISSDEIETITSPINIIDILGHKLTVMPWQSLIVRSEGITSQSGICFIEPLNQGQ